MAGVPPRIVTRLRAICLALPGAYEEAAWVGTRWMVRKRNFAHVVHIADGHPPAYARAAGDDGPLTVLTIRASPELADTLRTAGPPFFFAPWGTKWGTKVIGIRLVGRVKWAEVTHLVSESYRLLRGPARTSGRGAGRPPPGTPRRAGRRRGTGR